MADALDLSAVDPGEVSRVLARRHREEPVGNVMSLLGSGGHRRRIGSDTFDALLTGAGWTDASATVPSSHAIDEDATTVRSFRTLPDTLRPGLRLVIVGINPSPTAADTGVPFARAGNRFWPAALAAGLVSIDRDPAAALDAHGVGFTDVVNRTTSAAAELTTDELRAGLDDLELKMAWARPSLVVVMGVTVWRALRDPGAELGPSPLRIGDRPAWVAPNPSGRNAHVQLDELTDHLRRILDAIK